MRVRIPQNLDFDILLSGEGVISERRKSKLKEKLAYICHCLYQSISLKQKQIQEKRLLWFPLNSKILQNASRSYVYEIQLLVKNGVIEQNRQYIQGSISRTYRFADKYSNQDFKWMTINDYQFKKTLRRINERRLNQMRCETKGYDFLRKWFGTGGLEIDIVQAMKWVEVNREMLLADKAKSTLTDFQINSISVGRKIAVERLHGKDYYYKFDDFGGRFYSNLSNLNKELRKFVTYDGDPLVSLDLKNSQPYLATLFFDNDFWQNRLKDWVDIGKEGVGLGKGRRVGREEIEEVIKLVKTELIQSEKGFQDRYCNLVYNGVFYEYLVEKLGKDIPMRFGTRDLAKKELLRVMYMKPSDDRLHFYKRPCEGFKRLFPGEYKIFSLIKQQNHIILPWLLQSIEKYVVIDSICRKFACKYPNAPLFTIHDCIVSTEEYISLMQELSINTCQKLIGYPPKFEIEKWKP